MFKFFPLKVNTHFAYIQLFETFLLLTATLTYIFLFFMMNTQYWILGNFFLAVLGFELRTLCLLGEHSTLSLLPSPFLLWSFTLLRASFRLSSSYLCLPHSWDHRHVPLCLAYCLRWGLANFLPRLTSNCHLPDFCFPIN
jgi:hypothetical protein